MPRGHQRETRRHGTASGAALHVLNGERPCDACALAKQQYDKRYRSSTVTQLRNRAHARAQARALQALKRKHPDEYAALYETAKREVFAVFAESGGPS